MITDAQRDNAHIILYKLDTLLNQFLMIDTIKKSKIICEVEQNAGSGTTSGSGDSIGSGDTGTSSGSTTSSFTVNAKQNITIINNIKSDIKNKLTTELLNLKNEIKNNI